MMREIYYKCRKEFFVIHKSNDLLIYEVDKWYRGIHIIDEKLHVIRFSDSPLGSDEWKFFDHELEEYFYTIQEVREIEIDKILLEI